MPDQCENENEHVLTIRQFDMDYFIRSKDVIVVRRPGDAVQKLKLSM